MKKRQLTTLFLSAVACFAFAFGLSACETGSANNPDTPSHTHSFTNYVSNGDATCEENGTETAICDNDGCGAKDTRVDEASALGHSFTNYESNGDGTKTAVCDNGCQATDTITDETYYTEGLTFTLNQKGDAYSITDYTGTAQKVYIPTIYENLPVTSIGERAFFGCDSLTKVVIPDSVTSIGDWAFRTCHSLTKVVIPDSVTSIGERAFFGCDSLTKVVIPDSVTSIGYYAFDYCTSLTIYCEANTKPDGWDVGWDVGLHSGYLVVWDCNNNEVADDGCIYTIIDGLRYALKDGNATVVGQPRNIKTATIPSNITYKGTLYPVTSIGDSAFQGCYSLTKVVIPDSVTSIGDNAFWGCSSLTEIVIPDGVTSIGDSAFQGCYSLTIYCEAKNQPSGWASSWNYSGCPVVWDCNNNEDANDGCIYTIIDGLRYGLKNGEATVVEQPQNIKTATIPSSVMYKGTLYPVTSIGSSAFRYCKSLTEIVIPDSVMSIGGHAFYYCSSLTEVVIPDSVTSIGYNAFENCTSLTEVVIPDSVTTIGGGAFQYCSNLTIYCEAESEQSGWSSDWNLNYYIYYCPVEWGYKGE